MAAPPGEDTVGAGLRMLPAGRVTGPALRGLSRFADTRGLPASRESWLDYDVIEAFCVAGLAGRSSSTRGTYRSALYRLAEAAHGPAGQRATPFAGARAPAPYSPAERAELAAVAAAQRDPARRSSALAMVVLGIGAGLRPGELVALRGGDVFRHGRQVMVQVSGPSARVAPVASRYAGRAWQLARRAGSDFVFRPGPAGRSYKNFVASFARGLAADPAAAALPVRRARSTFICARLLFQQMPGTSRRLLAVPGTASGERAFLAAYRRVRYCFAAICSVMDPSPLPKNRRLTGQDLTAGTRKMTPVQAQAARGQLEAFHQLPHRRQHQRPDRRRTRGVRRQHRAGRHRGPACHPTR